MAPLYYMCTVYIPGFGMKNWSNFSGISSVPDRRRRSLEVVVVRRINNLGTGNLEWGGSGED